MSDNHESEQHPADASEDSEATPVEERSSQPDDSADASGESTPTQGEGETEEAGSVGQEESSDGIDELFLSPDDSDGQVVFEAPDAGDHQAPATEVSDAADDDDAADDQATIAEAMVSSAEFDELRESLAAAERERDEVKERMIRTAADLENFRKRTLREKEEHRKYGIDKVVLELLPVLDNLDRALGHADKSADSGSIVDGIRMVQKQFVSALQKHGVQGFDSVGDAFDPQRHEAIQQVETADHETGTVLEQYQRGYMLHERLIRPAMVVVAKKLEAPAEEPAPAAEAAHDLEDDSEVVVEIIEEPSAEPAPQAPAEPSEGGSDTESEAGEPTSDASESEESAVH